MKSIWVAAAIGLCLLTWVACSHSEGRASNHEGSSGPARDFGGCDFRFSALLDLIGRPDLILEGYRCADAAAIRLGKELTPVGSGEPNWQWIADASAPPLQPDETFVTYTCRVQGTADGSIVAVARVQDVPVLTEVRAAWRVDPGAETLVPIPSADVTCDNEEFGL